MDENRITQDEGWGDRQFSGGSARDTVYQIIKKKIIDLDYKPGEALSDKRLTEELGVSRTPVREALIILAAADMVIFKPQRGTFVAPIDTRRVETEQFVRRAMEKEIVQLACRNVGREAAWQYEQNLAGYRHYISSAAPDRNMRLLELDNEFHRIAFTAAGNESCFQHMLMGMQHIERLRYLSLEVVDQNEIYRDHLDISQAVMARDAGRARDLTERHLYRFVEDMDRIKRLYPEYFTIE